MKTKIFFLSAMLASVAAGAQSHINIEMLSATYTAPAVQFRVSWSSIPTVTGQIHNAKVWVWIDFLKLNVDNTTAGNTWTRAEVSATPAVSSSPTSTAALDASTNKGFWLNGVTGSYSATVTATLSNIPANTKFNWCAYVSDYPPNVTLDKGTFTFKGTTDFIVSNPSRTLTTKTIAKANLTVTSSSTFTDATSCPGIGSLYCPYTGSDLYMDATHLCQQRASGARNWEAWIKDTRDGNLYRIVYMPDSKWWLAEDLRLTTEGRWFCDKTASIDPIIGRYYTVTEAQGICPVNWQVPIESELNYLRDNCTFPALKLAGNTYWGDPTSGNQSAADGTNMYGFSLHGYGGWFRNTWYVYCRRLAMLVTQTGIWTYGCYVNDGGGNCATNTCGTLNGGCFSGGNNSSMTSGVLRCVRQL